MSTIEQDVFGGVGRVDVVLQNEHRRIACEITLTNSPDYEIQNIQKCLGAGFEWVVVVSSDPKHLTRVRTEAERLIEASQFERVRFVGPDVFHLFLDSLSRPIPETTEPETIKGYKVETKASPASDSEIRTRKGVIQKLIDRVRGRQSISGDD